MKNKILTEERARHDSIERLPSNARPKTLDTTLDLNPGTSVDFPTVVEKEDGFIKFIPHTWSHRKNFNLSPKTDPTYDDSPTGSILQKQRQFIKEHRQCSLIVAGIIGVLLLLLIVAILLLVFLPRKENDMNAHQESMPYSSGLGTTPASSPKQPDYPTGIIIGQNQKPIIFNDTIDLNFESLLPDLRRPNSFLAYHDDILVSIQTFIFGSNTPSLSTLTFNISIERENCNSCYILDATNDCIKPTSMPYAEEEFTCNRSSLIYCCKSCNTSITNYESFCSIYGSMYSSTDLLLSTNLYVENEDYRLQYVTIEELDDHDYKPPNEKCQLSLATYGRSFFNSGKSQICYSDPKLAIPSYKTLAAATSNSSTSLTWRAYLTYEGTLKVESYENSSISYTVLNFGNSSSNLTQLEMFYNPSNNSYMIISFMETTFSVARILYNGTQPIFDYDSQLNYKFDTSYEPGGWFSMDDELYVWYKAGLETKNMIYISKFEFRWSY